MKKLFLKKILLALGSIGFCQTALADEITGSYVQGDLGFTYMKADTVKHETVRRALKSSYHESKFMPRISVGYDFGDWRVAGDYTHYGSMKDGHPDVRSKTTVRSAGIAAMYDFNTTLPLPVTPYAGARLSLNKVKQENTLLTPNGVYKHTHSSNKVSPGVLVGVNYKLNRHLTVDTGYRYNHLDSKVQTHEASVGLRYTF